MFLISQLIGLVVINAYSPKQQEVLNKTTGEFENITVSPEIPYGMQPPETKPEEGIIMLFSAIIIAVILIFGYRSIIGTKEKVEQTELALFKNQVISDIKSNVPMIIVFSLIDFGFLSPCNTMKSSAE